MVNRELMTNENITFDNEQIQKLNESCYLGSSITNENRVTKEIRGRIALANQVFKKKMKTANIRP